MSLPNVRLIVIGGSAGALDVLRLILPRVRDKPCPPIAVVVHIPADGPALLHELLAPGRRLKMKQAEDKEPLRTDHVYFAPPGYHLLIERDMSLALSVDPPVLYSRPSIDVLFESAALACGEHLLAVLVTGASADGAAGLACIASYGGLTAVQTPASAISPYMPESALMRVPAPDYLMEPAELALLLESIEQTPPPTAVNEAF